MAAQPMFAAAVLSCVNEAAGATGITEKCVDGNYVNVLTQVLFLLHVSLP